MRIAMLSDVHANLAALEAVLEDAAARGAEAVWNLGDTVGYGPNPNEVVARLGEAGAVSVLGNHDAAAIGKMRADWFNPIAAAALAWTRERLDEAAASALADLPEVVREGEWSLAHGTLRDPLREYLITEEAAAGHFARQETPYSAVGHTHAPLLVRQTAGGIAAEAPAEAGRPLGEGPLCVNPGSVGQPRDGDPRASYALLDTGAGSLAHYRVAYDVAATQRGMAAAGLPPWLAERLALGQ